MHSLRLWRCTRTKTEVELMAEVYVDLIRKGLKTIEDVPQELKLAVLAILEETENE